MPFELSAEGEYLTPLPAMREALTGAGALLLSNPHNPMGKVFPREELLAVASACLDQAQGAAIQPGQVGALGRMHDHACA